MVKKHSFSMIPRASMPRSVFDRSYTHKTTFFEGQLIPLFCQEILPGDSLKCKVSAVVRLVSPTDVPIMDDLYFDMQFFFVPNRLVWEHWQAFNGEQANPGDSTDYLVPTLEFPESLGYSSYNDLDNTFYTSDVDYFCSPAGGTIFDYFGIPSPQGCFLNALDSQGIESLSYNRSGYSMKGQFNALPLRAYNLIWNEWYRDENLQERAYQTVGDGPDVVKTDEFLKCFDGSDSIFHAPLYKLLPRGKRHDYFTSCLPWPQKGPGVEVSIGEVYGSGSSLIWTDGTNFGNTVVDSEDGHQFFQPYVGSYGAPLGTTLSANSLDTFSKGISTGIATKEQAEALGLSNIGLVSDSITINDLRQAFQLQRLYERDARGGTRYIEILRSHFGVVSPDGRLQRPEYLGGFSQPLGAVNVPQTSATSDSGALGDLSSYICGQFSQNGFSRSFVEHGFVIGLASVRAPLSYSQGLHRMWSRKTRFDYYWPALAHLGEQAVLNKEIYFTGYPSEAPSSIFASGGNDDDVFGYQERWAEYRYSPNMISGLFRPNSLDLARYHQGYAMGDPGSDLSETGERIRLLPNGTVSTRDVAKDSGTSDSVNRYIALATVHDSLSFWHLSQVLGVSDSDDKITAPALNASFISDMPPVSRVVAVPSEPHFNCDVGFNMRHARVMPAYSVPGLIDHF